jgi:hypothetical protein
MTQKPTKNWANTQQLLVRILHGSASIEQRCFAELARVEELGAARPPGKELESLARLAARVRETETPSPVPNAEPTPKDFPRKAPAST